MDLSLLRHQSDSRYCFSLDESHVLIRLAVSKILSLDDVKLIYGNPQAFTQQHYFVNMELKHSDQAYNYYEVILNIYMPQLMYVFYMVERGQEYYYSESGVSDEYIFDLAFISAFQYVGENYNDYVIEKPSWVGRVFYQIFPERFASSDRVDKSHVNMNWDTKELVNNRNAFLGGDLYGASEKIPYLKSIGIGAIYLTPIHPSMSNHKYDVLDYYRIDPTFGGEEAFKQLVETAHENDIKVMMDLVFNHCSYNHPFFQDVVANGTASPYYEWFFVNGEYPTKNPLNFLCFGNFYHMPKLNTNNKEVQEYLIDVAKFYMQSFHVDGFRLDVSEGVAHDFWIRFKIALKDINPEVLVIGENWYNSESYLGNNQFDSVMNYPFLGVVSGYVNGNNDEIETAELLDGLLMRYKDGHNRMMMNLLASHDVQRFVHLCNLDKDLSLIGYAILMFYIGYPSIYYGEEIFMDGANDPDNRRGMEWDSTAFNSKEHRLFVDLIKLRKDPALAEGDIEISSVNGLLKIRRMLSGSGYVLYTNLSDRNVHVEGNVVIYNHYVNKDIEPGGFAVFKVFD